MTGSAPTDDRAAPSDAAVEVTSLASGGEGVGRMADGRVVFVEGAAPGDLVLLEDVVVRRKVARARVGRLLRASPVRTEPRCRHFGTCGGCVWQHIDYATQLDAKRRMVADALERIGGLGPSQEIEIVASPEPWGYRARARPVEVAGSMGFRRRRSREPIALEECPVLLPAAERALVHLAESRRAESAASSSAPDAAKASRGRRRREREWLLSANPKGDVSLRPRPTGRQRSSSDVGSDAIELEVLGLRLRASAGSFLQGNALLWDALVDEVRSVALAEPGPARFCELYAGIGFLTCALARAGLRGVAIESDVSAARDLAWNLDAAGLADRVEVLRGRVESRGDLARRIAVADLLVVDPPRVGLDPVVRAAIIEARPARVVYVSCDAATLARDLRELATAGYSLASIRAFDLFPQTPHVETVVRLERPSSASAPA